MTYRIYAMDLMRQACDFGDGKACVFLGILYDYSLSSGIPAVSLADDKKAMIYFKKACDEMNTQESCKQIKRMLKK